MTGHNINNPADQSPYGSLSYLPDLLNSPVLREQYCNQKMTDTALEYLWLKRPDRVRIQGALEPKNYDSVYVMELAVIVDFFRKEAINEIAIPETRLGMLDLLFELSRRLRLALDIPEWELRGRPLAETPDAPLPPLPVIPIAVTKGRSDYFGLTQAIADRVIEIAYKKAPHLFFERVECLRRGGIWPWDTIHALNEVIKGIILPDEREAVKETWMLRGIGQEITYRLVELCEINGVIARRE